MHSDYVVADVSYPNPNVFYELGLRHASKPGTVIIKDKKSPKTPFDIAHLRYIEYENTASGLLELTEKLSQVVTHYEKNPLHPDSHFLELAKLMKYQWPNYGNINETPPEVEMMMSVMGNPELMNLFMKQSAGEEVPQSELFEALMKNPNTTKTIVESLVKSGGINLSKSNKKRISQRRKKK